MKVRNPVSGALADITTRSLNPLCGEPGGKFQYDTVSGAFVGVYRDVNPGTPDFYVMWAQVGYMRVRNAGATVAANGLYIELVWKQARGVHDGDFVFLNGLPTGNWEYMVRKDQFNHKRWHYFYDGVAFPGINWLEHDNWVGKLGDEIQWFGEITHKEDKLTGKASATCDLAKPLDFVAQQMSAIFRRRATPDHPNTGRRGSLTSPLRFGIRFLDVGG